MSNVATVAIVAHISRTPWLQPLEYQTGATATFTDDDTLGLGCYRNHLQAWQWHAENTHTGWAVVIEDDALPIPDFPHQLDMALASAPEIISIASLYLGRARPVQYQIRVAAAVSDATNDDHAWIITTRLLSAVGVAVRAELVGPMVSALHRTPNLDIDEAITKWAGHAHLIGYTSPSLLDHRDTPTIAQHRDGQPRLPGRKAWRTGTRDNWKSTTFTVMRLDDEPSYAKKATP